MNVAVVGAGIVGLSVAWFLQARGVEVTIFDRRDVGAGASAGNAGWISPGLAVPLPDPRLMRYGLRSLLRAHAPLRIPPAELPAMWRFLACLAANCRASRWNTGVASFVAINNAAIAAYDAIVAGGVVADIVDAPIDFALRDRRQVSSVRHEVETLARHGLAPSLTQLREIDILAEHPILTSHTHYGLRLEGQRYLQPLPFVRALANSVLNRGGRCVLETDVIGFSAAKRGIILESALGSEHFDAVVLANGAWMSRLAAPIGVRLPIAAGRGYSFIVGSHSSLSSPLYFPEVRVACTPSAQGVRVGGTMEFSSPDAPHNERRIEAIVASMRPFMKGIDWDQRRDTWVGPRPVTSDGLPLIGATRVPNAYVAGGHGMFGMTLGPVTGQLLAKLITSGEVPAALQPFDPCR